MPPSQGYEGTINYRDSGSHTQGTGPVELEINVFTANELKVQSASN